MKNELIVNAKPISNFSEDVRTIRTNIEFLMSEKEEGNKVFLITSASYFYAPYKDHSPFSAVCRTDSFHSHPR